jgi:chromosome segregation ATPase
MIDYRRRKTCPQDKINIILEAKMAKGIPENIDIVRAMDQLLRNPRVAFSPEAVRRVRDELVSMRGMKERVEQTIQQLQEANRLLMVQIDDLRRSIDELASSSTQKDAAMQELRNQLAAKEREVASLAAEVDAMFNAAALEAVAKQLQSSSAIDDCTLGSLGDEATELLKRLHLK